MGSEQAADSKRVDNEYEADNDQGYEFAENTNYHALAVSYNLRPSVAFEYVTSLKPRKVLRRWSDEEFLFHVPEDTWDTRADKYPTYKDHESEILYVYSYNVVIRTLVLTIITSFNDECNADALHIRPLRNINLSTFTKKEIEEFIDKDIRDRGLVPVEECVITPKHLMLLGEHIPPILVSLILEYLG